MDEAQLKSTSSLISEEWDKNIIPALEKYISIPNQSPIFDKEWATNGLLDKATEFVAGWMKDQKVPGMTVEILRLPNRTPLIYAEVEATKTENVNNILMYGHLDKQPPLEKDWNEGLHPYKPVIKDGKLYGRGGADDGYAAFAATTCVKALKNAGIPHDRYVIIIEASEESGSPDLPAYVEHLTPRFGKLGMLVCLDSGAGNYDQFWLTSSLRGLITGELKVQILKEGIHSGVASGVVPSSFRIIRQLLNRIEDVNTGEIIKEFQTDIPAERIDQSKVCAQILGNEIPESIPFVEGAGTVSKDNAALLINRSWKPALSITGAEGLPDLINAGNVLRPYTSLKLSLRIPPGVQPIPAANKLKEILEKDPPYGAKVSFNYDKAGSGWNASPLNPWLEKSVGEASQKVFGKTHVYNGEGGSIPFIYMLGQKFPKSQFIITGLLGPASNAHGPNEFLHIEFGKNLTTSVSYILAETTKHALEV